MSKKHSRHKEKLLSQIRDEYGKVTYTERAQIEQYLYLKKLNKRIKYTQISLSAISTGGFIGAVVSNEMIAVWIGGIFATLLLAINLFYKDFNIASEMSQHRKSSDNLWLIRGQYVSLLTDFDSLKKSEIARKRDKLQLKIGNIYKESPKTDSKVFKKVQTALKVNEEQFFSNDELDKLLPEHLRFSKCDIKKVNGNVAKPHEV